MARLTTLVLILAAVPAMAQDPDEMQCAGSGAGSVPDWQLELSGDTATFEFGQTSQMDIPQRATAIGADWPQALTLIGGRETAIVILNVRQCSTSEITGYPLEVTILTQKGEQPLVLSGCCTYHEN